MASRDYVDFDLMFEPEGEGRYAARITGSPAGEASQIFQVPFNDLEIENYLLRFSKARATVRRIDAPELDAARRFGSTLFGAVFAGELLSTYLLSKARAEAEDRGLRIRLRLTETPELADLPWEFLFDSGVQRDFVALSDRTPIVRYPQLPRPVKPLQVSPPLRILLVVSSPSDYVQLDAAGEERLLRGALAGPIAEGLVEVKLLERGTLSALHGALDRTEVHVLHFIGHGGFDTSINEGVLIMEGTNERGRKVEASRLGTILNDHDPLRLVVLNACEGSRAGVEDPFSGVAPELARRGAPAVIAMQFEITDDAAKAFSQAFYIALANGFPVDTAVASARKAMFAAGDNIEWATPVLYLRSTDGAIFDIRHPPVPVAGSMSTIPEMRGEQPATGLEEPQTLASPDSEVAAAIVALPETEPTPRPEAVPEPKPKPTVSADEAALRTSALASTLRRAVQAQVEEDWTNAIRLLRDVLSVDAGHLEAAQRLQDIERLRSEKATLAPPSPSETASPAPTPSTTPPIPRRNLVPLFLILGTVGVGGFIVVLLLMAALFQPTPSLEGTITTLPSNGDILPTTAQPIDPTVDGIAFRFATPPTIDGNISDWWVDPAYISQFPTTGSLASFLVAWRLGWDEEALYVIVEVSDPAITQLHLDNPSQLWKGDSIHFEFGADSADLDDDSSLRQEDSHILIGPVGTDSSEVVATRNPPNSSGSTFVPGTDNFADSLIVGKVAVAAGLGYTLEAAIPWEVLQVTEVVPGVVFRMNLNASDSNADGSLATMMTTNQLRMSGTDQAMPGRWQRVGLAGG